MYVIDLRSNKIVATVTDTPGAEGVEYVPEIEEGIHIERVRQHHWRSGPSPNESDQEDSNGAKPDGSARRAIYKLYVPMNEGKPRRSWMSAPTLWSKLFISQ